MGRPDLRASVTSETVDDTEYCRVCGAVLDWEDCSEPGCDGGETALGFLYEMAPLDYDEDETEPCTTCEGKGGWWLCHNVNAHPAPTSGGEG